MGKKFPFKILSTLRVWRKRFYFPLLSRSKGVGSLKSLASLFVKYPLLLHFIFSQIPGSYWLFFSAFLNFSWDISSTRRTSRKKTRKMCFLSLLSFSLRSFFLCTLNFLMITLLRTKSRLLSKFSLFSIVLSHYRRETFDRARW